MPSIVVACCTLHNIIEHLNRSFKQTWANEYKDHVQSCGQEETVDETNILEDEEDLNEDQENGREADKIRDALKNYLRKFPILRSQRQMMHHL